MDMEADVLLPESISFNKYHYWIFMVLTMTSLASSWHSFAFFYISGRSMDHWCQIPGLENRTSFVKNKWGIPLVENHRESIQPSKCEMYDIDAASYSDEELRAWNFTLLAELNQTYNLVPCSSWVYDTSELQNTLTKQFGMVCDREWMLDILEYMEIVGAIFGSLMFGILGDRFGRRFILTTALTLVCLCGGILPFLNNYYAVLCLRFLLNAGSLSTFVLSYILLIECIPSSSLRSVAIYFHASIGMGMTIVSGVVSWFPDHVLAQIIIGFAPILLIFLLGIVPESPRWLRVTSHYYKYMAVMQKLVATSVGGSANTTDQQSITEESIKLLSVDDEEGQGRTQLSLVSIFSKKNFRRAMFHSAITWFTLGAARQVLRVSSHFLVLSVFNNGVLIAVVHLVAPFVAKHSFGFMPGLHLRHLVLWGQSIGSVVLLILVSVLKHPELDNFSRFLLLLARIILPVGYIGLYYSMAVLMPTRLRCTALGLCICVYDLGRLFAMAMQSQATTEVTLFLPMLFLGLAGLFGGVQHAFVPERVDEKLSDSFAECQDYIKRPPINFEKVAGAHKSGEEGKTEAGCSQTDGLEDGTKRADDVIIAEAGSKETIALETMTSDGSVGAGATNKESSKPNKDSLKPNKK